MKNINTGVVLETIFQSKKTEVASSLSDDDFFNLFVSEQIMKDFEFSYDELESGNVDGGGDGGIDSIFVFVNQVLTRVDSPPVNTTRQANVDIFLIQAKNTKSFGETPIEKCISSATDLFDLNKSLEDLNSVYNSDLISCIKSFREQYLHLVSKFPLIRFHYYYATKGDEVHPNVSRKVDILKSTVKSFFDKCEFNFEFITAQKLLEHARRDQILSKEIFLSDNPISTEDGGYISLVPIKNYYDFITDSNGELINYFFDANVRDYQVNVDVNKAIRKTLNEIEQNEDFWWLNNGVTITAKNATSSSKRIQIEDPQIVNGLQTSFEIHRHFNGNNIDDKRSVLLRIIKVTDEKSRLKVIKATNSQTNIPPASLRSTDSIHRNIEDYLLTKGFYYDRRKNYYKNQGNPIDKIISISLLSQIITAVKNQKPDYARARPSTLIKKDSDYKMIFDDDYPMELYYKLIVLYKKVNAKLLDYDSPKLSRSLIGDIRFHVLMFIGCVATNKARPVVGDISSLSVNDINDTLVELSISSVYEIFIGLGGTNKVAKGPEFVTKVKDVIVKNLT